MAEDQPKQRPGNLPTSAFLATVAVTLTGAAWALGWLPPMERAASDLLVRASTSGSEREAQVGAILIDDESIDRYGPLPWSRDRLAELVVSAKASGARGIALDLILAEATDPAADMALADAFAGVPVASAAAFNRDGSWLLPSEILGGVSIAAHAYGEVGPDGVVRTISATKQGHGLSLPALSLAAARFLRPEMAIEAGFLLFKLKPFDERVREEMARQNIDREAAEKLITKVRRMLPKEVKEDNIYMKLFKNIPRSDVEMVFPNTVVKFRLFDKIKLGVTSAGGLGMSIAGAVGKLALILTNPILALGALGGIGAVIFRQIMSFFNQKQRYMVTMAQNLYFHSLADNRGVMILLADRAAEEDIKEEILLYSVLCKEPARRSDLKAIDAAIERYLKTSFGVDVDFDVHDALERLLDDGIVTEGEDGLLYTLPPIEAAKHIDDKWDLLLDELPDQPSVIEGLEFEGAPQQRENVLNADGKGAGEGIPV